MLAERDAIQANLLELDGSFGKHVLEGAALTGPTRERWEQASAALAGLWETFLAYSAVVDRIAELDGLPPPAEARPGRAHRAADRRLRPAAGRPGPAGPPRPGRRGRPPVTLAAAVGAMRRAFAEVTEVTAAAEAVWAAVGVPLDAAAAELARARPLVAGLGPDIEAEFAAAESALAALRTAVNADPLALWRDGQTDTAAADRLRDQVAALTARIAELDLTRRQARPRIDGLAAAAAGARAARGRTRRRPGRTPRPGSAGLPPLPAGLAEPPLGQPGRAGGGGPVEPAGGRDRPLRGRTRPVRGADGRVRAAAAAAIDQRDELRGLLGAYKAKAARLGAAEDTDLAARYDQAQRLLWTAPCDLAAAEAAVAGYQRAILATEGRR